jgi:hypothetical protein
MLREKLQEITTELKSNRLGYEKGGLGEASLFWATGGRQFEEDYDPNEPIESVNVAGPRSKYGFTNKRLVNTVGRADAGIMVRPTIFDAYQDKDDSELKIITTGKVKTKVPVGLSHMEHANAHVQNIFETYTLGKALDLIEKIQKVRGKHSSQRTKKQEGGMPQREMYVVGGLASRITSKLLKKYGKNPKVKSLVKQIKKEEAEIKESKKVIAKQEETMSSTMIEDIYAPETDLWTDEMWDSFYTERSRDIHLDELEEVITELDTVDEWYVPGDYSPDDEPFATGGRVGKQEGGELDAQMSGIMEEEIPTHTMPDGTVMPGATHGEYEKTMPQEGMVPDEEMEADYTDFVISEALQPEEQDYLMNALSQDDELSIIVDKVIETASEFSGAGQVDGPGTPVSDSIPARLSDGEFVMTAKATDAIGSDTLQELMDLAEQEAPPDRQANAIGGLAKQEAKVDIPSVIVEGEDPVSIKQREKMLALDPRLSLFAS